MCFLRDKSALMETRMPNSSRPRRSRRGQRQPRATSSQNQPTIIRTPAERDSGRLARGARERGGVGVGGGEIWKGRGGVGYRIKNRGIGGGVGADGWRGEGGEGVG